MKENTRQFLTKLNQDIFIISLITFVILFFLELIKPKFVIAYIDLNKILLFCLIAGSVMMIGKDPIGSINIEEKRISMSQLLILSVVIFLFLLLFLFEIGIWGVLISFVGGLVSFLIGTTLNNNNENKNL